MFHKCEPTTGIKGEPSKDNDDTEDEGAPKRISFQKVIDHLLRDKSIVICQISNRSNLDNKTTRTFRKDCMDLAGHVLG